MFFDLRDEKDNVFFDLRDMYTLYITNSLCNHRDINLHGRTVCPVTSAGAYRPELQLISSPPVRSDSFFCFCTLII